jgi:hypothetical protein
MLERRLETIMLQGLQAQAGGQGPEILGIARMKILFVGYSPGRLFNG